MTRIRLSAAVGLGALLIALCAGCAAPAGPTASASVVSGSTPPSAAPTTGADAPVTFTYYCHIETPNEKNPVGTIAYFRTWEAVWADPTITTCTAERHGSVLSPTQENAVDIALAAYGGNRERALEGLSIQCAIPANEYLAVDRFSGLQVDEVRGILALCPDRPGAEQLGSALPPQ